MKSSDVWEFFLYFNHPQHQLWNVAKRQWMSRFKVKNESFVSIQRRIAVRFVIGKLLFNDFSVCDWNQLSSAGEASERWGLNDDEAFGIRELFSEETFDLFRSFASPFRSFASPCSELLPCTRNSIYLLCKDTQKRLRNESSERHDWWKAFFPYHVDFFEARSNFSNDPVDANELAALNKTRMCTVKSRP